jgi:hypothetical protein
MLATGVKTGILLYYVSSEVVLMKPEIRSTYPNIPIDNDWTDDELHCSIPRGCKDYDDGVDESEGSHAISTASLLRLAATELEWF